MNIELFGCAGGMAEGFRRAGVEFDLVIDRDPDACSSYEANLGHKPLQMDVEDFVLNVRAFKGQPWARLGLPEPESWVVDLLVADPPCSPWSRAGKRQGLDDPDDCMLLTIEIIRLLRPRCYLIGNVPGLGDECNLPIVQQLLAPLREAGYCTADFRVLNAADYGVPQIRRRPFWFGHLDGPCITWPIPTHTDPRALGLDVGLEPWVTCRQALGHLPPDEIGELVQVRHSSGPDRPRDGTIKLNPRHPPCEPDSPARTQTSRAAGGHAGAQLLVWPWDRPATTVTATPRLGTPGHHKHGGQFGPGSVRKLTERARALLQGFPEGWQFHGDTQKRRAGQIGKAMPPPLAEAVARSTIDQMARARRPPLP